MSAWSWSWIAPDATVTDLQVEYDVRGIFAPPVEVDAQPVPGQPGTVIYGVRHGPREFPLPLYVRHDDPATLHTTLRQLMAAMDPARGDGALLVTTPVGDQRQLTCRAITGLDLAQTRGTQALPTHQRATVVFQAADPYWYDVTDTASDFLVGSTTAGFFPILPLRLSSSEVFAETAIVNTGDVDTWPVWVITGPGSSIVLRNLTTGQLTSLVGVTLTAGENVTIDTRPNHKTVTRSDGTNLFSTTATTSLWPLDVGTNQIRVEMGGATGFSSVRLSRRHRYLTP